MFPFGEFDLHVQMFDWSDCLQDALLVKCIRSGPIWYYISILEIYKHILTLILISSHFSRLIFTSFYLRHTLSCVSLKKCFGEARKKTLNVKKYKN